MPVCHATPEVLGVVLCVTLIYHVTKCLLKNVLFHCSTSEVLEVCKLSVSCHSGSVDSDVSFQRATSEPFGNVCCVCVLSYQTCVCYVIVVISGVSLKMCLISVFCVCSFRRVVTRDGQVKSATYPR